MNASRIHRIIALSLMGLIGLTGPCTVLAAEDHGHVAPAAAAAPATHAAASAPTTQPSTEPSAQDVMRELLKQRESSSPTATLPPGDVPATQPSAQMPLPTDPSVMGIAPGGKQAALRREGEFITQRRGRLIPSANGVQSLFVFDADDKKTPETPMILMPSQLTQRMEDLTQNLGARAIFNVSGQVFLYHGVNYLLPTLMRQDFDRGNLQH